MKKISLLDEALFAYLEAQKAPNLFTELLALIQWDDALFSAGVYRLAAQGEAAIRADPASFTEDQWTASVLAIFLTRSSSYNADVFLKLSQAKTFNDRQDIRIEAGDGVHILAKLELYHQQVAKLYEKEVNKAETQAREADRKLDRRAKLATIKLEAAISAMTAQQAAPAAQQAARAKERAKPFSAKDRQEFARLWNGDRTRLGKPPLVRNFLAENKERLRAVGVESQTDVKRIKDAARKAGLMPTWHKRKSSGKKRQA